MTIRSKTTVLAVLMALVLMGGLTPAIKAGAPEAGGEPDEKGAAMLQLESGRLPAVPFPHRQHQSRIDDCNVCHRMFPQKRGAIRSMKEKGELKKQAVMNESCIACHKEKKMDGASSGPLSCTGCHPR